MTPFLYALFGATTLLLVLLLWALRSSPGRDGRRGLPEEQTRSNIQYFSQVQQALSEADREFLLSRGGPELAREALRERRQAALEFVAALEEEFSRLLRLARVIASLSPEVAPMQEFERVRLSVLFGFRLQVIRVRLAVGAAGMPQLEAASNMVSRLSVRMEAAMKELGERAALAGEMASAVERRDVHLS
jgi:hypothetical protein